jgi:hypothetical protein
MSGEEDQTITLTDEHHDWVTRVCGVDPRNYTSPDEADSSGVITLPEVTVTGSPDNAEQPNQSVDSDAADSKRVPRPMPADMKVVHGKVPGPKNHLLTEPEGFVVDIDAKMIIANSLADYKKAHSSGPDKGKGEAPAPASPPNSSPKDGTHFTSNDREQNTTRTGAAPKDVDKLARKDWPELTEAGARVLTAQFMAETGGGNCWNWNLGNVKAGPNEKHMYLRGVREVYDESKGEAAVAAANGLAHLATEAELKRWGPPGEGKVYVVYEPPHPQCRFKAYDSLEEGAQKWLEHMKGIAAKDPELITALNSGDTDATAKLLKKHGYYTAAEKAYAAAMKAQKDKLDKELGAP